MKNQVGHAHYLAPWLRVGLILTLLISALSTAGVTPARAATLTVTNANDSGSGSLRQAIADAAAGDTITFAGDYTILLTNELAIGKNLTITGVGHNVTISGNNSVRVFNISNAVITLDTLRIFNGYPKSGTYNYGGGIYNGPASTLTVTNCWVQSNWAGSGGGGIYNAMGSILTVTNSQFSYNNAHISSDGGGGIYNRGDLTVTNSIFSHNYSDNLGGGIYGEHGSLTVTNSTFSDNSSISGGGIYSESGLTVTNSTFYGNTGSSGGGGIYNKSGLTVTNSTFSGNDGSVHGGGIYNTGDLTVTNSTFSGNSSISGGGIYNVLGSTSGVTHSTFSGNRQGIYSEASGYITHIRNTLFANSTEANCEGTFVDDGGNLQFGGNAANSCGTSIPTANPLLGGLGNYGGPTQTIPLLPGSPAINAGSGCPATDQRGLARVGACDIGAFESQGFTLAKTGGDNQSALTNTAFANPLAVSISANNPLEPVNGGQISFTPPGSGASATITGSPKTISGGSASVTAIANGAVGGPYNVSASANGVNSVNFSLTNLLPTYTVTFDANGGSGSMLPQTAGVPTALNANTYTRTGYTFAGWSTASGGPVVYADGATYNFITNATLYAKWILVQADLSITKTDGVTTATPGGSVTYTITASNAGPSNANGATVADTFPSSLTATWTCVGAGGGTCTASGSGNINDTVNLPAGGSVTYTASASISAGATGTLSNTATVTTPASVTDLFLGNNSATDSDTLLPTYTVSYNANTATGGTVPGNQTKINGVNLTLANNIGSLVKTGYTLTGWNTASDGSGTHYALGGTYSTDAALALYAEWTFVCSPSITVANNADSGPGSLRQAIAEICPAGTIDFAADYTILLTSELAIGKDLTITGAGHSVTISGQNIVRVFNISPVVVTIDTLTIANGLADHGAGIFSLGYLIIKNSTFSDNRATGASMIYDGSGGAILSLASSPLTIQNSTFINNQALNGGGVYSFGPLSIKNSTFSGNSAENGGGIYATNDSTIEYSTLSGNRSATNGGIGGGLLVGGVAQLDLSNSVIANSTGADCYLWGGSLSYAGYNLIEDGSCGAAAALSGDPLLGTLGNYGGLIPTIPLLPGSPAIDAPGSTYCSAIATDQRDLARPQGAHCDLGSFESQGFTLAKTGGDNRSTLVNTAFANPLSVSITANDPLEPVNGGQIIFAPPASGASAVITGSPTAISGGAASVAATANGTAGGPYNVSASANGANSVDFRLTNLDAPVLTINDVSAAEGASGATSFIFTVSLSIPAQPGGVTFDIATADGTATSPSDYVAKSLTSQTIPAGSSTYTFNVTVNGDTATETDETFSVNITNVLNANLIDGLGLGTITNDDFAVSITTEIHNAVHTPIISATLGESLHASATVIGTGPSVTGSVTFTAFDNPSCFGTGTVAGMVNLIGNVAEPSQNAILTTNGLSFRARYNGDSNYLASDGGCVSLSTTPYPTVLTLSANTLPQDGSILTVTPSNLLIQFSLDVLHGSATDTHSAENPVNYLLVAPGVNGIFDTATCGPVGVGGLQPDDTQITVNSASYDPSTFIAKLKVNNGTALSNGVYRLFICGTTSITDTLGTTYLNNHTADSVVTFTLAVPSSQPGGNRLPATGFAPNVVTLLPEQPAANAYADEGMWLEIPTLGVKQQIVGVPGPDWNVTWLGNQIGYLQGTAFPTWNGNSVLTGHATNANGKPGPFADLGTLSWGNQVIINAWGQQYIYEVRTVNLQTEPKSTGVLTKHEKLSWLTLITCRGYDEQANSYRWRTVVRAVLVSIK